MSTEYETNLSYDVLMTTKQLIIQEPKDKAFGPTHKLLFYDGEYAHVIKDENGNALIMRYGKNNVRDKILPILVSEFDCMITDYCGLNYPDCLD